MFHDSKVIENDQLKKALFFLYTFYFCTLQVFTWLPSTTEICKKTKQNKKLKGNYLTRYIWLLRPYQFISNQLLIKKKNITLNTWHDINEHNTVLFDKIYIHMYLTCIMHVIKEQTH